MDTGTTELTQKEEEDKKSKEEKFALFISRIDSICSKTAVSFLGMFLLSAAITHFFGEKYAILGMIIWFAPMAAGTLGTISTGTTWYGRIRFLIIRNKVKQELKDQAKSEGLNRLGELFGFLAGLFSSAAAPIGAAVTAALLGAAIYIPETNFLGVSRPNMDIENIQQLFEPPVKPETSHGHKITGKIKRSENADEASGTDETITVALLTEDSIFAVTSADSSGFYGFYYLPDGNYTVAVNSPAGNYYSTPFSLANDTTISQDALVPLAVLQETSETFAELGDNNIYGKLSEFDYISGEPASVALLSDSSVVAVTSADSLGNYSFLSVPDGNYTIGVNGAGRPNVYSKPFMLDNDTSFAEGSIFMTVAELTKYRDSIAAQQIIITEGADSALTVPTDSSDGNFAPEKTSPTSPVVKKEQKTAVVPVPGTIISETQEESQIKAEEEIKMVTNIIDSDSEGVSFEDKKERELRERRASESAKFLLSVRPEFTMIMNEMNNAGLNAELGFIAKNGFFLTANVSGGEHYLGGGLNIGATFNADGSVKNSLGITGGYHNTDLIVNVVNTRGEHLGRKDGNNIGIAGGYWKIMFGKTGNFDITNRVLFGQRSGSAQYDNSTDNIVLKDGFSTTYSVSAGYTLTKRRK